jgi:molybdopterin-synthase adenylyltransferase
MNLSDLEVERYSRQLVLPEWSGEVQERLEDSSAVVVGAGALGCPAAAYLAGAGVGRIGVVDSEEVELSNLHRQTLHFTPDIGESKALSAAAKLGVINPETLLDTYPVRLEADNAEAILTGADVVVDCSDTFATRYVVNDACCMLGVPLVEAGVLGPVAGIVGSIQALEALKLLTGVGEPLLDTILQLDAASMRQTLVTTARRPDCPACAGLEPSSESGR